MKNIKKIVSGALAAVMASFTLMPFAEAKQDPSVYQQSVVFIYCQVQLKSSKYSFETGGTGTGFAVAKPGEKVQYIATCDHCVREEPGVYTVWIDPDSLEYIDYQKEPDGTPTSMEAVTYQGIPCIKYTDHFNTETIELRAIYSNSSNDYTNLTVAQYDHDHDLALCKLASEPTDKISALPLQLRDSVSVNTDVVSVGYASTSRRADSEKRYDKTDVTLKDGIISKVTRSNGNNNAETTFDIYETSADITTGMSGGPLINENTGAVVGVNSFGNIDQRQAKSSNFAICVDYLIPMLDAERVPYETVNGAAKKGLNMTVVFIIAGAVLVIALGAILVIVMKKKKASPAPAAYVDDGGFAADDHAFVNTVMPDNNAGAKKYYLLCTSGPLAGKKFGVTNIAVIGRDKSKCNVVFPADQPGVSGVHCEVRVAGGVMTVKDCGSSYGTFLADGSKLEQNKPVPLTSGSRFWVGAKDNMFEVRY